MNARRMDGMDLRAAESDLLRSIDEASLVRSAQKLIGIPSENPPGDYGAISSAIKEQMDAAGLETFVLEGRPGKKNVVGVARSRQPSGFTLLLSGHTDVVPAGDRAAWKHDPYAGVVEDRILWGRGSADMKAAIAAQIEAAKAVLAMDPPLKATLMLAATVDDEIAGPMGMKYLLEAGLASAGLPRPSFHVLGEATRLDLMTAFKGRIWAKVKVKGKAAHGGAPYEGVSAIENMIRYISRVKELPYSAHRLTGPDTINVGTISGGTKVNVVADFCEATFDLRMGPPQKADDWVDRLRRAADEMRAEDPAFVMEELEVFEKRQPVEADMAVPELAALEQIIEEVRGTRPRHRGTLSAGDLYYSLTMGIPGTWFGPGDPGVLHKNDEHVSIDELVTAAKVYALTIWRLCVRQGAR